MDAMRWMFVFVSVVLLAACSKPDRFADGWDKGGKLHEATLREWAFATDANRIATTADFVREHIPDLPPEALPLTSALVEQCISDTSQRASVEYRKARDELEHCFIYAQQKAEWMAAELEKEKS